MEMVKIWHGIEVLSDIKQGLEIIKAHKLAPYKAFWAVGRIHHMEKYQWSIKYSIIIHLDHSEDGQFILVSPHRFFKSFYDAAKILILGHTYAFLLSPDRYVNLKFVLQNNNIYHINEHKWIYIT